MNLKSAHLSIVLLGGILPIANAFSQSSKPAPAPALRHANAADDPDPTGNILRRAIKRDEALVTVDFPGGTVTQYVEALRNAVAPTPFNVIVSDQAAGLTVPPTKLTNASLWSAISSLARSGLEPDGRYLNVSVHALDAPENGSPTYRIQANYNNMAGGSTTRENSVAFVVLSLNPIVGLPGRTQATDSKLDAKAVLSAVEAAVIAAEEKPSSPPMLKFHEPSGLLFVRGSAIQQSAAEEVVRQLRKDVEAARSAELAATAGRSTQKVLLKGEVPDDLAQRLRKHFEGRCCVQFETDGKYIIITGDRELVSEAAQLAYINDQTAIQRKEKEATKK